jgi:hypothetical protein
MVNLHGIVKNQHLSPARSTLAGVLLLGIITKPGELPNDSRAGIPCGTPDSGRMVMLTTKPSKKLVKHATCVCAAKWDSTSKHHRLGDPFPDLSDIGQRTECECQRFKQTKGW